MGSAETKQENIMLSLNDIKIIFYGPDFATKLYSPLKKKILHFIFLGEFFLNLTVLLTKIMPKGPAVQVAKFKVPLIRSILVYKDILPK